MEHGASSSTLAARAQSRDPDELLAVAASHALTEEIALSLLTRRDLPSNVIEAISKNPSVLRHRKVSVTIASHPSTPRHVSLPLTRHLYTFDLVKIALLPGVPADVKVAIDETIVSRLDQISEGERLTLAKQASGRVAGVLLRDPTERIVLAALQNSKMTEAVIISALGHRDVPAHTVRVVGSDAKWSLRRDIRLALLRCEHTPLAAAIKFVQGFPEHLVREVLGKSRMKPEIRKYLLAAFDARPSQEGLD